MKTIITIGYYRYLVSASVNVGTLFAALGKLQPCEDKTYENPPRIVLTKESIEIELKSVSDKTKVIQRVDLAEPQQLALGDGK